MERGLYPKAESFGRSVSIGVKRTGQRCPNHEWFFCFLYDTGTLLVYCCLFTVDFAFIVLEKSSFFIYSLNWKLSGGRFTVMYDSLIYLLQLKGGPREMDEPICVGMSLFLSFDSIRFVKDGTVRRNEPKR